MLELIRKAENSHDLSLEEAAALLAGSAFDAEILAAADRVREKYVGPEVHLRALIEFSNNCFRNCHYCGLRRDNEKIERYRMTPDEIIAFAARARDIGYRTVVLQSGEDASYSTADMVRVIGAIKEMGVAITLSVGEKKREEYEAYKSAGADRFLLRIETSNRALYEKLDPGMRFDERVRCLEDLGELGYELGTGCLVGLPGQTVEDLARDLMFFREIGADMVGLGPFIPNPDTPLAGAEGGSFVMAIKMMALVRLLMPDANIPATTAMETLDPNGRLKALQAGANVVMPNVTDTDYKKRYILYPGKICLSEAPEVCGNCVTKKIESIGRVISKDHGNSKRHAKKAVSK